MGGKSGAHFAAPGFVLPAVPAGRAWSFFVDSLSRNRQERRELLNAGIRHLERRCPCNGFRALPELVDCKNGLVELVEEFGRNIARDVKRVIDTPFERDLALATTTADICRDAVKLALERHAEAVAAQYAAEEVHS